MVRCFGGTVITTRATAPRLPVTTAGPASAADGLVLLTVAPAEPDDGPGAGGAARPGTEAGAQAARAETETAAEARPGAGTDAAVVVRAP